MDLPEQHKKTENRTDNDRLDWSVCRITTHTHGRCLVPFPLRIIYYYYSLIDDDSNHKSKTKWIQRAAFARAINRRQSSMNGVLAQHKLVQAQKEKKLQFFAVFFFWWIKMWISIISFALRARPNRQYHNSDCNVLLFVIFLLLLRFAHLLRHTHSHRHESINEIRTSFHMSLLLFAIYAVRIAA